MIRSMLKALFVVTLFAAAGVGVLVYTGVNEVYNVVADARQGISDAFGASEAPEVVKLDKPAPFAPTGDDFGASTTDNNSNSGASNDHDVLREADRKVAALAKAKADAEAQADALQKLEEDAKGNAGTDLALAAQATAKTEEVSAAARRQRAAGEAVRKAATEAGEALLVKQAAEAARTEAFSRLRGEMEGASPTTARPTPINAATPTSRNWLWPVLAGATGLVLIGGVFFAVRIRTEPGCTVALRATHPTGRVEDADFNLKGSNDAVQICASGLMAWAPVKGNADTANGVLTIARDNDGNVVLAGGHGWKIGSDDIGAGERVRAGSVVTHRDGLSVELVSIVAHRVGDAALGIPVSTAA